MGESCTPVADVKINLGKLMQSKERAVTGLTKGIEFLFKKNGVSYVKGHGTLESATSVRVKGADGKEQVLRTKHVLLATGSEPSPFPGLAVDERQIVTSTGALSLEKIPEKMLVIGGGVIGLELGSVWSRLGTQVTVVEYMPSIGAGMDAEMAYVHLYSICSITYKIYVLAYRKQFHRILQKQNLAFKLGTKVLQGKKVGNKIHVEVEPAKGGAKETVCAIILL